MPARKHAKHITQKERFALTTALLENYTKSGPGRRHKQGNSRKQTAMKYPGTHRAVKEKK